MQVLGQSLWLPSLSTSRPSLEHTLDSIGQSAPCPAFATFVVTGTPLRCVAPARHVYRLVLTRLRRPSRCVSSILLLKGLDPDSSSSYAIVGGVCVGAGWYMYRLAMGPSGALPIISIPSCLLMLSLSCLDQVQPSAVAERQARRDNQDGHRVPRSEEVCTHISKQWPHKR